MRRTQQEFLSRIAEGLPPTMTFVFGIGNNDLWPNNKNSAHNFEVDACGGWSIVWRLAHSLHTKDVSRAHQHHQTPTTRPSMT